MSTLEIQSRDGSKKLAALRKAGFVPMALLQRDHTTLAVQASLAAFKKALGSADSHGRLDVKTSAGKKIKAIVKNIDQDPLTHILVHAVLQEVTEDDTVKMDVPIVAVGTPSGLDEANVTLMTPTDHIKIRGQMGGMPDHIDVDISGLSVGGSISAGDVALPAGFDLLSSPDTTLFSLSMVKEVSLEPETAEGTEPAVVSEGEATSTEE